jgi:hypothetical protein
MGRGERERGDLERRMEELWRKKRRGEGEEWDVGEEGGKWGMRAGRFEKWDDRLRAKRGF